MNINNTLIDNSTDTLTLRNILVEILNNSEVYEFRIATGYWDLPGMSLIIDQLENFIQRDNARLMIIIGKDPYVYASQIKNPKYQDLNYPSEFIRRDIEDLEVKEEYQRVVDFLMIHCKENEESSKVQIRLYNGDDQRRQFFHSKCYIINGKSISVGIVGSSNFTAKGLGENSELNYLETDWLRVMSSDSGSCEHKSHLIWFKEKWEKAEQWNKVFLEQCLKGTKFVPKTPGSEQNNNELFTPYELYIKLLQIKFGDIVDQNITQQIESYLPKKFDKLDYQIDAVKRCINIMHEHGGFMLADVVGLGKTIVGCLIIKRFLLMPEDTGRERKVLIIAPPAIRSGWKKAISEFDKCSKEKIEPLIDIITTGKVANLIDVDGDFDDGTDSGDFSENLKNENYGLIMIDESHKFRNSSTIMYQALDDLITKIGSETGVFPYIGLLSATPQNNRPNDLKNQIYLFERNHTVSTLKKADGGNISSFFARIGKEYQDLLSNHEQIPLEERKQRLEAISKELRDCILSDILERRTRTDVKKYYKEDMERQGLVFPGIVGPNSLEYVMDDELADLFSDTMTIIAPSDSEKLLTDQYLHYFRYRAIEFIQNPDIERIYSGAGNRTAQNVSRQLANIMKILLVKRLESSFTAFKQSLLNLRRYTENMILMWEKDTIFICPQIDVNKELDIQDKSIKTNKKVTFETCADDIRAKIKKLTEEGKNEKNQNAEYRRADFNPAYIDLLKHDYQLISQLYDRWSSNSEDPKFDKFKESLQPILFDPSKNTSQKLVIFSESIDTVDSLVRAVKKKGYRVLPITAANRNDLEDVIESNFDANYDGEQKDDYDVIITTEVLAEGINLHRANVILNYDTPWNSTRLMQRIGRVNRIGSTAKNVYVYNFMPSAEGDDKIKLVRKAHAKLQSFHVLFGEDSKIFSQAEDVFHYDIVKSIEGEESPLQQYVYELKQYKGAHPDRYNQICKVDEGWEIASSDGNTAYCLVQAPKSAQLSIKVTYDTGSYRNEIISLQEMIEALRVDESAEPCVMPEYWKDFVDNALIGYNQHFVRLNKSRSGDRRVKAMKVINDLFRNPKLSPESKTLLKNARMIVDKGNFDLIKRLNYIGEELAAKESLLFNLEQSEIDEMLKKEISNLVKSVENNQGKPKVLLGTII